MLRSRIAAIGLAVFAALPAAAADLVMAIETEPAIDPHFSFVTTNIAVSRHIFDSPTRRDANMEIRPGLAQSWRALDDLTWEFRLRADARFHDGAPVTAADVIASIQRIPDVPNNPNPYTSLTRSIETLEAIERLSRSAMHPFIVTASRRGFVAAARMDDELQAMSVRPE